MAISIAVQKGSTVFIYDENKNQIGSRHGELYGFTSSTISIKKAILFMFMMKKVIRLVLILADYFSSLMF